MADLNEVLHADAKHLKDDLVKFIVEGRGGLQPLWTKLTALKMVLDADAQMKGITSKEQMEQHQLTLQNDLEVALIGATEAIKPKPLVPAAAPAAE